MPNYQRRIVYLSEAQREELFSNGSITVNGTTITYDANDMYVTPQEEPYVKPASGIPASDLASGVVPDLTNYVQKTDYATSSAAGVVKTGEVVYLDNENKLRLSGATATQVKNGANANYPITPSLEHSATFYGLAKAAGDTTQASSSNAVGTYTDTAKAAIQTMLGVPSASDLNDKVDKSAIEDAGITGYTYSTLFGGEFSVTTAASNDYISPYVRAAVTGRISKHYMHRVTFNGTEYILPTRLWFNADAGLKVYEYLGNLNLYVSDISGVPDGTDNVPFVIISDLNNSGSIDVLTSTAGTYAIKVERIVPTKKDLPKTLIYGDNYVPIEKINNGGTYNGFSVGVNELKSSRGSLALGYGNVINHDFGTAIGIHNDVYNGFAIGHYNHVDYDGFAIGYSNNSTNASTITIGEYLTANCIAMTVFGRYNVSANMITPTEWQSGVLYHAGDQCWYLHPLAQQRFILECTKDHVSSGQSITDDTVDGTVAWALKRSDGDAAFVVGNGFSQNSLSNAMKIDWAGNAYFNGNAYVNCNADSSGGTQLPTDIQINGTSIVSNGVANIPVASLSTLGAIKYRGGGFGISINADGGINIDSANASAIKSGASGYLPVSPMRQHESVFYGLAKAAGADMASSSNPVGTYTDAAKTAIQTMLGIDAVASTKADKNNTVITGSLSMGRLANSTVGENSTAIGYNSTASSVYSFASGYNNVSSGPFSTTVGYNNTAYGKASFSGGMGTGTGPSAEAAFAYGRGISSQGSYMTGFGLYSIVPTLFPEWVAGTSYSVGDRVTNSIYGYECITANSDSTFNTSKWKTLWYNSDTAFVIGNGSGTSSDRSNAFKIDINGNVYLGKDIYINCNADSTGGTKLESGVSFVETVSGTTPSITGEPNTRYMCGEVTSIAIMSPSAGAIDVVFTSGSTPAVLTVTPPTGMTMKWPAWFDSTSLATNTTYEINIMDGVYGAVMAW